MAHNRTAINKVVLYTSLYNSTATYKVQNVLFSRYCIGLSYEIKKIQNTADYYELVFQTFILNLCSYRHKQIEVSH